MDARGPIMHAGENRKSSNADAIGIEMGKSAAERTPTDMWFKQIDHDMDHLDAALDHLFQRLQPVLNPGFHGSDASAEEAENPNRENSMLVETLKMHSRRLQNYIERVEIVTRRVEL